MPDNDFHKTFAERFRGSKKIIWERLRFYNPFIEPFLDLSKHPSAVDLGCGRGEWLEILSDKGFDVSGFDKSPVLLKEADGIKAKIVCEEAISSLSELSDSSCHIVSAFHFVEHISFDDLQKVVREAFRILQPGGLIILETPNPENILVSSKDFYRDPTHVKPIPPEFLSFVVEQSGFFRNKIIRLQEDQEVLKEKRIAIRNVLNGASPDYAVIGQKPAPADILRRFDVPFSHSYGVSLEKVVADFDSRFNDKLNQLDLHEKHLNQQQQDIRQLQEHLDRYQEKVTLQEKQLEKEKGERLEACKKIEQLSHRNGGLEVKLANEKKVLDTLRSNLISNNRQLERLKSHSEAQDKKYRVVTENRDELFRQKKYWRKEAKKFQHMYEETLSSRSWKITAPLRKMSSFLYTTVKPRPVQPGAERPKASDPVTDQGESENNVLTASARKIYQELRLAIKNKKNSRDDEDSN